MKRKFYHRLEKYLQAAFPELGITLRPEQDGEYTFFGVNVDCEMPLPYQTYLDIEGRIDQWLAKNVSSRRAYRFDMQSLAEAGWISDLDDWEDIVFD